MEFLKVRKALYYSHLKAENVMIGVKKKLYLVMTIVDLVEINV